MPHAQKVFLCLTFASSGMSARFTKGLSTAFERPASKAVPGISDGWITFHDPAKSQEQEREPHQRNHKSAAIVESGTPLGTIVGSDSTAAAGIFSNAGNAFLSTSQISHDNQELHDSTDYDDYNDFHEPSANDDAHNPVYDSFSWVVDGISRIHDSLRFNQTRDDGGSNYNGNHDFDRDVLQNGSGKGDLLLANQDVLVKVSPATIGDQQVQGTTEGNVEVPESSMTRWSPISFLRSCMPLVSKSLEIVGNVAMAIPPPAGLIAGGTMMFAGAILETGGVGQEDEDETKITTFQNAIESSFNQLRPQLLQIDSKVTKILNFVKVVESQLYAMDGKLDHILDLVQEVYERTVLGRDKLQEINQLYVGLISRLKVISMEGAGALDWASFKNWLNRLSPETLSRNWGPLSSDNLEMYLVHMAEKVGDCEAAVSYHAFATTRIKLFGLAFIREVVLFGNTRQSEELISNLESDFKLYDAILHDLNLDHAVQIDSNGACQGLTTTTSTRMQTTTTTTRFVMGSTKSGLCPAGSFPISSRLICYWAAIQFEESYSSLYHNQPRRPRGCYIDGKRVRFNLHYTIGPSEIGYKPLCDTQPGVLPPFDLHDPPGSGRVLGNTWIQSRAWTGVRGSYPMCASGDRTTGATYKFKVHMTRGTYHQVGVAKKQCCQNDKTSVGEGHDSYNFAALNSFGWERNHGAAIPVGRPSAWWNGTWNGSPQTMLVSVNCRKRSFKVVREDGGELLGEMSYPKPSAGKLKIVNGIERGWDPYGENRWDGVYAFVGGQSSDHIAELSWVEATVGKKRSGKGNSRRLYRRWLQTAD